MNLHDVHQGVQKRKSKKRVGRGIGSGHGKTASRGHKGQYASAGAGLPSSMFSGGQTPLYRRVPKRGFNQAFFARVYAVVNVADLDALFNDGDTITPEQLKASGLAKKPCDGYKILGDGELTKKLTVSAHLFSKSAIAKIEAKGGTVTVIPGPKKPVKNKMKPRPPKTV
ncbi:50S ribosomal protein L15 [Tuwongella immobilis]|uniref:Large ribosomal subunit protein uL15 n=1 Tax=Tuwongella immobilis TaxID=692036 RepID=A0A6C2YNS1_9BACT|nr:50S ribosomal protein L15 [Tuwongella immobilis]VIP02705.1 50s ribosomal protein l15 : 50S ribosomal protein L15 OS=Coprobacillus sp. CAG:605 GN=rplO PE=3 SV=1: Ribosomal_L18e [Tuwongella immobilis]VTS02204.1 50s ribosomal protein l15 : 50S ribosomal protein L15 OS=Coprobacillus sp. CAG:605 GN=rplO PE=3 SV=1: Ribosomal_L18e [Tuwongella immobilis]